MYYLIIYGLTISDVSAGEKNIGSHHKEGRGNVGVADKLFTFNATARNKCLQFVIPQDIFRSILQQLHDAPSGSPLGVAMTLSKISSRFYWPGQRRDVVNWCKSCELCAARKSPGRLNCR